MYCMFFYLGYIWLHGWVTLPFFSLLYTCTVFPYTCIYMYIHTYIIIRTPTPSLFPFLPLIRLPALTSWPCTLLWTAISSIMSQTRHSGSWHESGRQVLHIVDTSDKSLGCCFIHDHMSRGSVLKILHLKACIHVYCRSVQVQYRWPHETAF